MLCHETFDEAYFWGMTNTALLVPNYGVLVESWSGLALERAGALVPPFVLPALDGPSGRTNFACGPTGGSIALWLTPHWSSSAEPEGGTGPAVQARLAELAAVGASDAVVVFSLQVTPDGNAVVLIGPNGDLLKAPISWRSGEAHFLVLNYGPEEVGTALFLDGQLAGLGPGTVAIPEKVAALVLGSTLAGTETAGADLDEFYATARPRKEAEVGFDFRKNFKQATLGPITPEEDEARLKRLAELLEARLQGDFLELMKGGESLQNCTNLTLVPTLLTNGVLQLDICGGSGRFDLFFTTNLSPTSTWVWLARPLTNQSTLYVTNLPPPWGFFQLGTMTDSDRDGLPDAYENLITHSSPTNGVNLTGPFSGELANGGERIALVNPNGVIVDEVTYSDGGRWGRWADGGGSSSELIHPRSDNRLASNWGDSDETTKAAWTNVTRTGLLDNVDGSNKAEAFQLLAFGAGEYLIDDVNVSLAGIPNPTNLIQNPTFNVDFAGWLKQGNHIQSLRQATGGVNNSGCLRLRASGRGDTGPNRVYGFFAGSNYLSAGSTGAIAFQARWLRGEARVLGRLRGNHLEASVPLPIPANLGTAGAVNSCYRTNSAPAIFEVSHHPVLPAANQSVLVTARVHDPDGVTTLVLKYRVDPSSTLLTLALSDNGLGGDTQAGDGLYSAVIQGRPGGTLVAFRIEATDALGTTARFPVEQEMYPGDTERRECLVRFGDPGPGGSFPTYRLWMTQASVNHWATRFVLSNDPLDVTFVYGGERIIYNAGAHYSGSWFSSLSVPYNSPTGNICGYTVVFPPDDLFFGSDEVNLDWPAWGLTGQNDQVCHWMAGRLGLPFLHRRFVHLIVNGRTTGERDLGGGMFAYGTKIYEDTQQPGGDFLAQWYLGSDEGDLYKFDPWYEVDELGTNQLFQVFPRIGNYTTTGGVKKQARYRWNWSKRRNRTGDDYGSLFSLMDALMASSNYTAQVEAVVEAEQWMRLFALEDCIGNGDCYGNQYGKNMFGYVPPGGTWKLLAWDTDATLGINVNGYGATNRALFTSEDDPYTAVLQAHPPFRRAYWRGVEDAVNGPMLSSTINPVIDGNYQALSANQVLASTNNFPVRQQDADALKTYVSGRRAFLLGELAKVAAPFEISNNNGDNFTVTNQSSLTLVGKAPVAVAFVRINSTTSNASVTWTSVTNWSVNVALTNGPNPFAVRGYDRLNVQTAIDAIIITRQ